MQFCDDGNLEVRLQGEVLKRCDKLKHLGSTASEDCELDAEISHRIRNGWKNRRDMTGVLCDKRLDPKVKGKVYKTAVRPEMLYVAET